MHLNDGTKISLVSRGNRASDEATPAGKKVKPDIIDHFRRQSPDHCQSAVHPALVAVEQDCDLHLIEPFDFNEISHQQGFGLSRKNLLAC
jgi:hypothetical protein